MNILFKVPVVIFIVLMVLGMRSEAGVLVLNNGDRVSGELLKLEADKVVWQSDSFGKLSVNKNRIENLHTVTLLKINGIDEPCALLGMEDAAIRYSCRKGINGTLPLLTMELAMPYEEFRTTGTLYRGKFGLSGTYSRGNKVENDWDLDAGVEARKGDLRHTLDAEYENKSQNNQPANEKYKLEYGLDWFYQTRWFLYNDVEYSADESKNIDERHAFSSGFGFQMWEFDKTALSFTGGLTYVKELFDTPAEPAEDFADQNDRVAWQFGIDYRYRLPFDAKLFHKNSIFQSFEDSQDWRFESDTGINMPLWGGLFSEVKLEYDYDNDPQGENRREDSKLKFGVGYTW
mgnify:CR=1 FL=1